MGDQGPIGAPGMNIPVGGTSGQVLAKASEVDYATEWITPPAGGSDTNIDGGNAYTVFTNSEAIDGGGA